MVKRHATTACPQLARALLSPFVLLAAPDQRNGLRLVVSLLSVRRVGGVRHASVKTLLSLLVDALGGARASRVSVACRLATLDAFALDTLCATYARRPSHASRATNAAWLTQRWCALLERESPVVPSVAACALLSLSTGAVTTSSTPSATSTVALTSTSTVSSSTALDEAPPPLSTASNQRAPIAAHPRRDVATERDHVVAEKLRARTAARTRVEYVSIAKGYGVIAEEAVAQGAFVMEFAGELVSHDEARRREAVYASARLGSYLLEVAHTDRVIDPTARLDAYGHSPFLNHAIEQRTLFARRVRVDGVWRVAMHAACDISPGDELTFDYNERRADVIAENPWLRRT